MPQVLNKNTMLKFQSRNAVYVGRPSAWGNPFVIGKDGTREEVIEKYQHEILPTLNCEPLRGKDLVCFCAPLPCHADLLLKKANARRRKHAAQG